MTSKGMDNPYKGIYEYSVIIAPDELNWERLKQLRVEFADHYNIDHAKYGRPHLYLANFVQFESREPEVLSCLAKVAAMNVPFRVNLSGFGAVGKHNIHVKAGPQISLLLLIASIKEISEEAMTFNEWNKPHFFGEPHFTIARKLNELQFEKIWPDYANRIFTGDFQTSEIVLLKREFGSPGYQPVEIFPFDIPVFHEN